MGDRNEEWLSRTDFKLRSLWKVRSERRNMLYTCTYKGSFGTISTSEQAFSVAVGTDSKAKESNLVWRCTYCSRIP
jgi:hypothetical protein